MRNRVTLLLLLTFSCFNLFATHYRGVEITYRFIGPYQVAAYVTTYTKFSYPSNLADRDSVAINWGDGTTSILPRVNGTNNGTCSGASPCGNVIATDIKQSIYEGAHTYSGSPLNSAYYVISFNDENLLGGIANIDNGNGINVMVFTADTVYMGSNYNPAVAAWDASPVFLNPAKYYAFMGDTFTFNSAAVDPDGDSLSYSLMAPQQAVNQAVPIYVYPDAYCQTNVQGQNNNLFQINAQTGQITWATPCAQGFFQFAIEVREYRCGLYIGNVVRNMQIVVLPYMASWPVISAVHDTVLQPGQPFQLSFTAAETSAYTDSLQLLGGPFVSSVLLNRPTFAAAIGNPATGTFNWTPSDSFIQPYAYLFTIIATNNDSAAGPDGTDPYPVSATKTFRVWVQDTAAPCVLTGINEVPDKEMQINIFPNPANSILHIQSAQQFSNLQVFDLLGRVVTAVKDYGTNYDLPVTELPNGVYLLSISLPNATVTRRFVKIE